MKNPKSILWQENKYNIFEMNDIGRSNELIVNNKNLKTH